ncbi:MAG: DUF3291 domain-containing protein [Pseudomonadota bacterium]
MMHVAQLNIGRLLATTDDPQVRDFMQNLDCVNGLGKRMPGFVWMMEGSGEPGTGNTDTKIDGDPQFVSNLTVWESVQALETFVWGTIHKQFYDRKAEWFAVMGVPHFVMWLIPVGHRPTLEEGLDRLAHKKTHGDSDYAFGWDYARASLHKTHACDGGAA